MNPTPPTPAEADRQARDENGLTADQRDMLALMHLRDTCAGLGRTGGGWMLLSPVPGTFRCVIGGPARGDHEAPSITEAILGAMRKAGLMK